MISKGKDGTPRYLRDNAKDDYSYVNNSISRITDKIRQLNPALADRIVSQLKTGLRFEWKDTE